MYRMIVVDDEVVEREGIINFIEWSKYDIEIVGDAQNGLEGLEVIKDTVPDIILTDVKMPFMNGIEMIKEAVLSYPDCIYVVLSGYGDYEYTSKAMSLGVRHYILKPCDEDTLVKVLNKVKKELEEKNQERLYETERYNQEILKLLPKAKMQFLRSAITNQYMADSEFIFYEKSVTTLENQLSLLVFKEDSLEHHLSSFVVENIFEELMNGKEIFMKTEVQGYVVFLLENKETARLETVTRQVQMQFEKIFGMNLRFALSAPGSLRDVFQMYTQAKQRLEKPDEKLDMLITRLDLTNLSRLNSYGDLLLEYHALLCIFRISELTLFEMKEGTVKLLGQLYGEDTIFQQCRNANNEQELYETVVDIAGTKAGIILNAGEKKMEKILRLIYFYSSDVRTSIQWMAKQVLYINEDYLARIFKASMKQKLPDYLCMVRMETAARIIKYHKNCSLSELAQYTGYHEDGRYFSKVFKKYFGKTLLEYRNDF